MFNVSFVWNMWRFWCCWMQTTTNDCTHLTWPCTPGYCFPKILCQEKIEFLKVQNWELFQINWIVGHANNWDTLAKLLNCSTIFSNYYSFRLTPVYAILMLSSVTLMPHITRGPMWPQHASVLDGDCPKVWWSNLLYINNIVNLDKRVNVAGLVNNVISSRGQRQ